MADDALQHRAISVLIEVSGETDVPQGVGLGPRFSAPLMIAAVLNPINTTMISVALVPISRSLGVSTASVIWLVVALYLTSAIFQPVMGTLADHFGPRRVFILGLIVVIAAGSLPLLSHTFAAALIARIVLGVGTSAAYPAAMTAIRHQTLLLGVPTPPTLLSSLSIASLATAAAGPVLGGALVLAFGWEAVFAVNLPVAAVALVLGILWLPKTRALAGDAVRPSLRDAIDLVGIVLFATMLLSLLLFVLQLSLQLWWLLALFAASAVVLVLWERHRRRPFIDVRLLVSNGALSRTYVRIFLTYLGPYVVVYAMSQWLQDDFHLSSASAGIVQFPSAVLAGIASLTIARSHRVRAPLIVVALVAVAGGVILTFVTSASPLWFIVIAASVFGITQGLATVSNQVVVYRKAPADQVGSASGLSRTAIGVTAILASSLIAVVFGQSPSDDGLHILGWIVAGSAVVAFALTALDPALRDRAFIVSEHGR